MGYLVQNEQTKLLAGSLATIANSGFTVGILAPLATLLYASSSQVTISGRTVLLGSIAWTVMWIGLQGAARWLLKALRE